MARTITVVDTDRIKHDFPEASSFSTDEANNLCVWEKPNVLWAAFSDTNWFNVVIHDG